MSEDERDLAALRELRRRVLEGLPWIDASQAKRRVLVEHIHLLESYARAARRIEATKPEPSAPTDGESAP